MIIKATTHVFGVMEFNGDIPNNARCNWKSEIQDRGRQTGSTYISASIADSTIEFLDPENMGLAVGISLLSAMQAEI